MIRLGLSDGNNIVRWALGEALGKSEDIEVVGEAATATQTLAMVFERHPEVLLLDIGLPDRSGFDVLADLRQIETAPFTIVLSWHPEPGYATRAIAAGAHGYISKTATPQELIEAIRSVSRGEPVLPGEVEIAGSEHPTSTLTAREQQVMEMLSRGMTNREIADYLSISIKTVDTHRGHVLKKLGLRNNSELTRFAVKHGYISV